jgi:hypothetical protein
MSARDLIQIPIWKGNRTIDLTHAEKISEAVGSNADRLDFGYRIVRYDETDTDGCPVRQTYLIDGQHRAHVLREHFINNLCTEDFKVVVIEKNVQSETEAIDFFNEINNVKPQRWATDPNILVNQHIAEIEKNFNIGGKKLIRPGATTRPYLSVDRLREALKENIKRLPQESHKIKEFGLKVLEKNRSLIEQAPMFILANTKNSKYYERAAAVNFMLAVDPNLRWMSELLG